MTTQAASSKALTARGAKMRERIVSAAADTILAKGAADASLDDVMEISGASKSQIYHYFADKDELLREAATLQASRVLAAQGRLAPALDSLEALRKWRDAVLALDPRDGCPLGALVYQLPRNAGAARARVERGFDTWRVHIESGFAAMKARGELSRDADPARLALAVLSALQGGLLMSRAQNSRRPLEIAFDMALSYVAANGG